MHGVCLYVMLLSPLDDEHADDNGTTAAFSVATTANDGGNGNGVAVFVLVV